MHGIEHTDTVCTAGVTNFHACLNPAGMELIKSIDPEAIFIERFSHTLWGMSAMHHTQMTKDRLRGIDGFARLYEWMVDDASSTTAKSYGRVVLMDGFPYEIDVKEGSPLVGWFNVMKGVSNG